MTTSADAAILSLTAAAEAAQARESLFRAEAAATTQRLEAERATAFRRLNFMRALMQSAAAAETAEAAQAAARAHIRSAFGWETDSEARTAVLERIAPVASALFAATHDVVPPEGTGEDGQLSAEAHAAQEVALEPADPAAALSAFESWYEQTRASSFWFLFEHYMPETPRVDY